MRLLSLTRVLILAAAAVSTVPASAETKTVALTAEQMRSLDIKVEAVRPAEVEAIAVLPATVVAPLNSRIVATAPFAGTVTRVHVLPGEKVDSRTPVATISSRELLDVQAQLSQSQAELQMADAIAKRKRLLADKRLQSPLLAEEAEAQVAKIKAVIEQHEKILSLNGITLGQDDEYSILVAKDGTVVELNAMPGEMIDTMDPVVTVDTSDRLWVEAQIPADLVSQIKPGTTIRVVGGPEGRVVSVGTALQGMTRSAILYAEIPASSTLVTGQIVSIQLERSALTGALSVPAKAVTKIAGASAVFVRCDDGFTVQTVELRGRSPEFATIVGDLPPDAAVAASGIPQLQQMLQED